MGSMESREVNDEKGEGEIRGEGFCESQEDINNLHLADGAADQKLKHLRKRCEDRGGLLGHNYTDL